MDEEQISPGARWMKALQEIIPEVSAAAVFLGPHGVGDWQQREIEACLQENVHRGMPVIPIPLPHLPDSFKIPAFLKNHSWIDLRPGLLEAELDRLARAVKKDPVSFPPKKVPPRPPRGPNLPFLPPGDLLEGRGTGIDPNLSAVAIDLNNLASSPNGLAKTREESQSPERAVVKVQHRRNRDLLARPIPLPEKGSEILGILFIVAGIFLVLGLSSYNPQDPSLLHPSAKEGARAHNWIGSVGAHISALVFGFFGPTCLLIPLFLVAAGWWRLRRQGAPKGVGRSYGAMLLLAAVSALLHIGFGRINWRDGSVAAGGAIGALVTELLESRLNHAGTLVVLGVTVVCGLVLVVRSTLGNLPAKIRDRLRQAWQYSVLARERRRERREKERTRRRVIIKHLQRVAEEKQRNTPPPPPDSHRPSMAASEPLMRRALKIGDPHDLRDYGRVAGEGAGAVPEEGEGAGGTGGAGGGALTE